nr:dihydrolipoyllysine-residue acetyltransferase [Oceanococcus sp. HetDA_MAG_MS8]
MDIRIPDIGDFDKVPVIEVLVAEGDTVAAEDPLIVLESDKATMEVPAPAAGTITKLQVKVGDEVGRDDVIGSYEPADDDSDADPDPDPDSDAEDSTTDKAAPKNTTPADDQESQSADDSEPQTKPVTVPDIGDFDKVPVIEVLVAEGDSVAAEDPLIVLESDKATMEVPAPEAGTVTTVVVKQGDSVGQGDTILHLQTQASAPSAAAKDDAAAREDKPQPSQDAADKPQTSSPRDDSKPPPAGKRPVSAAELPYASPSIRKFARELGVDLQQVKGSGRKGRILREDVKEFVQQRLSSDTGGAGLPPAPQVDYAKYGPVGELPLARIRQISATHLHRSWLHVPHVTQNDWADITDLEDFRKQHNADGPPTKLTLLAFVLKACAVLLQRYPDFNSALAADGKHLIRRQYCHLGFAADTPNGLVVPVIRDVDQKSLSALAAEAAELAASARAGKLKPDQMQGGCFSVSSLGGIGGSHFTPIVNSPEVAILGVSKAVMQPQWDGQSFVPRLMCPLSLSYDHRVIDGAAAARFTTELASILADIRRLLL